MTMRFLGFIKGVGVAVAVGTGMAVLSGAAFERISRERVANDFPAPGRMVSVNGHTIQIDCRGTGSPTVVFESGLDYLGSLSWASVHDSIAATTRACAYSRPGVMWSDKPGRSFDVDSNAAALHDLLAATGEHAPYVLVAHSLGGAYATVFTSRYPGDVAGLVMVDASHPGQFAAFEKATGRVLMPTPTVPRIGATLAWTGLTRLIGGGMIPETWPRSIGEPLSGFMPMSLGALASETEAITKTLDRATATTNLGDRPLVVLSAGAPKPAEELTMMGLTAGQGAKLEQAHRDLAADMSRWSANGRLEVVRNSSHYIQFERPDAVIGAVREVVGYVIAHDSSPRRR